MLMFVCLQQQHRIEMQPRVFLMGASLVQLCSLHSALVGSPQRIWHEDPVSRGAVHEVHDTAAAAAAAQDKVQWETLWSLTLPLALLPSRWKQHEAYVQVLETKYADLCCKYTYCLATWTKGDSRYGGTSPLMRLPCVCTRHRHQPTTWRGWRSRMRSSSSSSRSLPAEKTSWSWDLPPRSRKCKSARYVLDPSVSSCIRSSWCFSVKADLLG